MGSYDKAIEKVSNSKLKKKEKENALAELEKEKAALQAAYEADKDGKMKSMYKQQHIESYFQDMAETSADVFDIEPYADIKRTTFQNYEARQTAENNQKYKSSKFNLFGFSPVSTLFLLTTPLLFTIVEQHQEQPLKEM